VHPLPIEEAASSVLGVQLAAAYGRRSPVTGQIVALDVVADPEADQRELEARIREACDALPQAARPRRIRFVPELELQGQKVARRADRA
jgi:acyl-coenzyme A synthetase/AMP-(fatty) acid ligase